SRGSEGELGIVVNFNGSGIYPPVTAEAGRRGLISLRFHIAEGLRARASSLVTFGDEVFVTKMGDTLGRHLPIDGGRTGGAVTVLPRAEGVLNGHVVNPQGTGLRNTLVYLTDADGVVRTMVTSSFGSFSFTGLQAGGTYVLTVRSRRYRFVPQV